MGVCLPQPATARTKEETDRDTVASLMVPCRTVKSFGTAQRTSMKWWQFHCKVCDGCQSVAEDYAQSFAENHKNPCESSSVSIAECPDVVLQKYKGSDPTSPCVPEPKDEL